MGVIWTSQPRTKQPSGEVGVSSKWATSARLLLAPGISSKNLANKSVAAASQNGAAIPKTATSAGVGMLFTTTSSHGLIVSSNSQLNPSPNLTVFADFVFAGSAGSGEHMLMSRDDAAGRSFTFAVNPSVSAGLRGFINAGDALAATAPLTVGVRYRGAMTVTYDGANSTTRLYLDGVLSATSSAYAGTINTTSVATTVGYRTYSGYESYFNGTITTIALFDRALSASEIQGLSANPWQLFASERRPIFFNTTGGGSTVTGVGSSDGVGTVSGVGASTSAQVGSSAGVGAASGVGASTANSVGSSTGTGTASGVGSSTGGSDGAGSATGTGTATGVGASTSASLGSTAGVGTASGIGASTAASVGSASGTGEALGVGANGSVVSTGVGSASGTGTATGISPTVSRGGGKTTGSNLSRKQKKKLKAVESQEWLKAEETARQLLSDRFTKQTPQEKAQALETYIESLQPVIEALKALTTQIEEVVEDAPVIELTPHQEVIQRFDRLEKKVKSVEELIIILMADL